MALSLDDFDAVFRSVYGEDRPPFLWQRRLLQDIVDTGWPATIAVPTGGGKTAIIDIALFHLAMEAGAGKRRKAPMRIVFAVDRRVIVDQAFDRACRLKSALLSPEVDAVARMADALRIYSGKDEAPLHVEQLRGGMPREDDWAREPSQPTVLCTTVDQLGSRLLFRGYGVSQKMAPIHAGLLGEDALLILDEAHLSKAFEETLYGVRHWKAGREKLDLPWEVVSLTATPRDDNDVFRLSDDERAEPAIAMRLHGRDPSQPFKPTCFVELKSAAGSEPHIAELVARARHLVETAGRSDPVVAVIVNRVALARAVLAELQSKAGKTEEAVLFTGRVRPVERDALMKRYENRLAAGSGTRGDGPLFVVATQCVEAGADFDFDALVTQIAPLDALRQRFGRVNRLGEKPAKRSFIVAAKDEIGGKDADKDLIYGSRSRLTWEWLTKHAALTDRKGELPQIDFGSDAMAALIASDAEGAQECMSAGLRAPVLRRADVEFFSMTKPRPHPDPELSLFLHGELRTEADVSIIWRGDLPGFEQANADRIAELVALLPPRSGEALAVPVWQARKWLSKVAVTPKDSLADVGAGSEEEERAERSEQRLVLRWRGPDDPQTKIVSPGQIRPGDTIIVPSVYGGCDEFGWAPGSDDSARDIAEEAAKPYERRRAVLRLHKGLWNDAFGVPWSEIAPLLSEYGNEDDPKGLLNQLASDLVEANVGSSDNIRSRIQSFRAAKRLEIEPYDGRQNAETDWSFGALITAPKGMVVSLALPTPAESVTDEDDAGSFRRRRLTLAQHSEDVATKARGYAALVGLGGPIAKAVELAARLHDDGKADPRFQRYLAGGHVPGPDVLAKSDRPWRGGADDRRARQASNLPERWRHEALSVRIAAERLKHERFDGLDDELDDLVLWLIGTHHGYGRPFFEHDDPLDEETRTIVGVPELKESVLASGAGPQRLDFEWRGLDWAGLFETLKRRYGAWGLAYLEAVVRLADHRASEEADQRAEET